jgi:hypothetical protein
MSRSLSPLGSMNLIRYADLPFTRRNSIRRKKMGRRLAVQLTLSSSGLAEYKSCSVCGNGIGGRFEESFSSQKHVISQVTEPYVLKLASAATLIHAGCEGNFKNPLRAVNALRERDAVNDALLGQIAPLGWNHIGLTGDYNWHANKRVAKGGFRPLRRVRSMESTVAP